MDLEEEFDRLQDEVQKSRDLIIDRLENIKGSFAVSNILLAALLGIVVWKVFW